MARWIDDIVSAMESLEGIAAYSDLYAEVRRVRNKPLPRTWKAIIRNQVESHSADSDNFNGRDLFYSVDGIGQGVWGLRSYSSETPKSADLDEENDDLVARDPSNPYRMKQQVYRILRDTALARSIKKWHSHRCQVCGNRLALAQDRFYSEAHHIKPLGRPHNGPDIPENILCVCPNHHALLDYGAIRIDPDQLRSHPKHHVGAEYARYHNSEIYPNLQ